MARINHGLRPLKGWHDPSLQLRDDILRKLREEAEPWGVGSVVSAKGIAEETGLAPGTVRAVMQRLVNEGVFRVHQGTGYLVLAKTPARTTTLVSVSEFCEEAALECVSVFDREGSCFIRPCAVLAEEVSDDADEQARFRRRMPELLGLEPDDEVLFIRCMRGWRKKSQGAPRAWAILETLFVVPSLADGLEARLRRELDLVESEISIGNFSLHRWLGTNHIQLERSEYLLSLGRLSSNDRAAWLKVDADPQYPPDDVFIRLRAVTYIRDRRPLLYTIENVVPGTLDFNVSGFQFVDPAQSIFP